MVLALYVLVLAALAVNAPTNLWRPETGTFLFVLGWVGVWRWSWGAVHLARSLWYRGVVFPRWRGQASALARSDAAAEILAPELFIVVTSYRIPTETMVAGLSAAVAEAVRYPSPVTIVLAVVEMADLRLAKDLFHRLAPPERVRLFLVRGGPTGKREALARSLRAVARTAPRHDAVVLVQDGDTVLPPGCLAGIVPFFRLFPHLAALTTDEDCLVPRGSRTILDWHRLRFAQRHLLMSSLALSRRLITITGRMSAYRAAVATDPRFIELIAHDRMRHWRLGTLRLLTGEDKSAAYWLLERGLASLYVPDVRVLTLEEPPAPNLLRTSTVLMIRWFGNMLRASGRCIALGPRRVGWFVWWCLVDQRVSMWTPLVGPIAAILLALFASPAFLYAYLLWVMATRLLQSLTLLTVRPTISGLYPPLLYFTQVYGALIKTWVLFRPHRQGWTRQDIALAPTRSAAERRWWAVEAAGLHLLALSALVTAVAISTGLLALPDPDLLAGLL